MNLVCLIAQKSSELLGKRVLVYSFGSGALATMFQITARKPSTPAGARFTLERMAATVNLMDRLLDRETVTPEELSEAIRIREKNVNRGGFVPQYSVSSLFPGTFYLEEVRPDFTRVYLRKPPTAPRIKGLFYPVAGSKVIMVEKILTPREGHAVLSPHVREVELDEDDIPNDNTKLASGATGGAGGPTTSAVTTAVAGLASPATTQVPPPLSSASGAGNGTRSFFPAVPEGSQQLLSGPAATALVPTSARAPPVATPLSLKSPALAPLSHEETLKAMLKASLTTAAAPPVRHNGSPVVITGVSAGLPGKHREVFSAQNLDDLVAGTNFITHLSEGVKGSLIEKNVVQLKKQKDGSTLKLPVNDEKKVIKMAAQLGKFDLTKYGVGDALVATMDTVVQVAIAAGLEALKDAGIVKGDDGLASWQLPENMRDSTGVVYATSFPALEAAVSEVMRFLHSKQKSLTQAKQLLASVKSQLEATCGGWEHVSAEDSAAYEQLQKSLEAKLDDPDAEYEFDRKFLFRILVLGNAQLAQIVGARGPNMQTNAACAGTTQAIALAQDIIQQGRCERLVVIASDNASGDVLIPWLGSGFRALGAASTGNSVEEVALPFDKRRKGLVLGAGAIGIVLETEAAVARRYAERTGLLSVARPAGEVAITEEHVKAFGQALRVRFGCGVCFCTHGCVCVCR